MALFKLGLEFKGLRHSFLLTHAVEQLGMEYHNYRSKAILKWVGRHDSSSTRCMPFRMRRVVILLRSGALKS